jgi:hypothetical protein
MRAAPVCLPPSAAFFVITQVLVVTTWVGSKTRTEHAEAEGIAVTCH